VSGRTLPHVLTLTHTCN